MRSLLLACSAALFAVTAVAADAPRKVASVEGITEYRLDNGMQVLLYPDESRPKVTVSMTVFVGSRHEGYGESGMAHLLEHLVFKGTPTHPLIPKALQEHGAQFNGTTNSDRTNYFETLTATDENLEFAIRLEADRLVNSYVKREDLVSEMTVVRNEFERSENSPEGLLGKRVSAVAFDWHNYGKTTIGNRSDIERVPIHNLQAFYRKYYQPDNAMVVVAGQFKEDKALALVQKYFGAIPRPERQLDKTYTQEPEQDGERFVTLRRVGNVPRVAIAWHIPAAAHPDFPPLQALANILDSAPSGPAYKALVQTKKATQVSTSAFSSHDPGLFFAEAEVPERETLDEVKETLISLIEKVGETGVTEEAVNRSALQIKKYTAQQIADTQQFAISLSSWAAQGDWRLFFINRDAVEKVTAEQIKTAAAKYFKPANRTVGIYLPTPEPDRVLVPTTPDIQELVKDYKGRKSVAAGEAFDVNPLAIEKRVQRTELVPGAKAALLPKKTRGNEVFLEFSLRYGNEQNLKELTTATTLLGPLMLRGTKSLSDQQFKDELDRLEATLSAFGSSRGNLRFSLRTKSENLPAAIGLLKQVLREPLLPAEEFEIMRQERIAEAEKARTDPQTLAPLALSRLRSVYAPDDVRYQPTYEEQLERLKKVTLEQVKTLQRDYLGVAQAEVAIVGDFDPTPCLKVLKEALANWEPKQPYERIAMPVNRIPEPTKLQIDTPDKANAVYAAGLLLPLSDEHPDYPALYLGNFIFGAGALSSRLGDRVRQKEGLSYGINSGLFALAQDDRASFSIQAICNPQNLAKLETVISEEFESLVAKGVTSEEVAKAKDGLLQARQVGRANDRGLVSTLATQVYEGRTMQHVEKLEKLIAALTAEEVTAALKKHLDPKRLLIVTAADRKAASSGKNAQ